ncbi:MAG: AmmeMemoRadiSam system protein A [Pseudomonadota bacterium]|nr:AmmeMemoRadiSam system protein A [Pseudomonadota bacterium]
MHSPEPGLLEESERRTLLDLARRSIEHGLTHGRALLVDPSHYAAKLRESAAAFVTLEEAGQLRGCIGHLEAVQPLVADVAENAFAAAFRDPRFPPLQRPELASLCIKISVLTPAHPMVFGSEADLLGQVTPGRDGLILKEASARGTFLPSVWDTLPEPREFLRHLKMKAGLSPDYWSDTLEIWRYGSESFSE